jgi:Fe-S cluster assembly protein SufD
LVSGYDLEARLGRTAVGRRNTNQQTANIMSVTIASPFSSESFESLLAARHDPPWLIERRRQAWEDFQGMDWPGRREEEWIRTDIRLFKLDKFRLPGAAEKTTTVPPALLADGVQLGGQSISVDSVSTKSELAEKWTAQGVVFGSLDEAVTTHGDLIQNYLMTKAVDPRQDRFAALHAAAWAGGHFLYVPKGVVLDQPLHAMSVMSDGAVDFGHVLVILEDNAEATLMTEMASTAEGAGGFHCGAIELFVAPNARLRFVDLQGWGDRVWHFAHQKAIVQRDATLQWTIAAMGSRLAKVNQHVGLAGTGAQSQVNGVLFTEGKQHLSYHTLQQHESPHTRSDFLYKAALQDKSRTVWRGMIKVDPGAQKTDGFQRNDNLLLSATARADSIPGLEIEADDVRCTHGSTSGRVDNELIFYAQTRGYTRQEAIRLIVTGFFQQVFDRITIDSVREALGLAIARRVREYE